MICQTEGSRVSALKPHALTERQTSVMKLWGILSVVIVDVITFHLKTGSVNSGLLFTIYSVFDKLCTTANLKVTFKYKLKVEQNEFCLKPITVDSWKHLLSAVNFVVKPFNN
ncbi:hypothetical protein JOB18_000704 [Solea senegalensis]|uniref:Uncharacterized protein n=1 Tax=Solea senegalensis TaxID=28829 RepID=A0AAV6QCB2_SOLSE|nr:hypothetical protein JOB18_000704 [Solea senegalensis]